MSVQLSQEKKELIKTIAESEGFKDYFVETKSGSMKGDGYLGIINTIYIQEKSKPNKELHLVLKSAIDNENLRGHTPVRKAYERETYFYKTVFPEIKKIGEEYGINNKFVETAKYYGAILTDKQECIVLENLKEIDFKLWNRVVPMNHEHVEIVFKTYGKLHASSFALRKLKPEKYTEMKENLENIFEDKRDDEMIKSIEMVFQNGLKAVQGRVKETQALITYLQNFGEFMSVEMKNSGKFSSITHGDCWCNNMMFRYTDTENPQKPTEVCLLDWQLSRIASPICDLSYFFYANASKEVLYDINEFLKLYYESFSQTLTEAGVNPGKILTFEQLQNEWKKFSKYGLFMAMFVMKVVVGDSEEAPDLGELANSGKNIIESITGSNVANIELCYKRLADIICFMTEKGYL